MRDGRHLHLLLLALCTGCAPANDTPDPVAVDSVSVEPRRLTSNEYLLSFAELSEVDGERLGQLEWTTSDDGFELARPLPPAHGQYSRLAVFGDLSDADASILVQNADAAGRAWGTAIHERYPESVPEAVRSLAARAWRLPPEHPRIELLGKWLEERAQDVGLEAAAQGAATSVFVAPEFLFVLRNPTDAGDSELYRDLAITSELTLSVLGRHPSSATLDLAQAGLGGRAGVESLARSLIDEPESGASFAEFGVEYLKLSESLRRTPIGLIRLIPTRWKWLVSQAREYLSRAFTDGWTLRDLLVSPTFPMTANLAEYYDVQFPADGLDWDPVEVDGRAGLLTLGAFLAQYSEQYQASPIRRGAIIIERLLCAPLEVPAAVPLTDLEGVSDRPLTIRERLGEHLSSPSCAGCHGVIDPIGHSFGYFAANGQLSPTEAWWPLDEGPDSQRLEWLEVDVTGDLPEFLPEPLSGAHVDGVESLVDLLSESEAVHQCFTRHLAGWFLGREVVDTHPDDIELLESLADASHTGDVSLAELARLTVTSDSFLRRFELEEP